MRVLIISDTESSHGASIATTRLADGLLDAGEEVHRIYAESQTRHTRWKAYPLLTNLSYPGVAAVATVRWLFPHAIEQKILNAYCRRKISRLIDKIRPDVVNVHNIFTTGLGVNIFNSIPDEIPTVWTLHDMRSATGACGYAYQSNRFITGCNKVCSEKNECFGLDRRVPPDQICNHWKQKREIIGQRRNFTAVTPSTWLQREMQRSAWADREVAYIPYGLDLKTFRPIDRSAARDILQIKTQGPVVLLTASDLNEERKGVSFALEALKDLAGRKITLLTMGHKAPDIALDHVHLHHLGFVSSELLQAVVYSAADVMLHPSLADNLPNSVMESIACGTPVVAFDSCGLPDLVKNETTGWLAGQLTVTDYRTCLLHALEKTEKTDIYRQKCRQFAEESFPSSLQAEKYISLFKRLP